jgi:hypothetical protein
MKNEVCLWNSYFNFLRLLFCTRLLPGGLKQPTNTPEPTGKFVGFPAGLDVLKI